MNENMPTNTSDMTDVRYPFSSELMEYIYTIYTDDQKLPMHSDHRKIYRLSHDKNFYSISDDLSH